MKENFREKQLKLAEIVENREIRFLKYGEAAVKFSFVRSDDGLKCILKKNLTPPETARHLLDVHISDKGFTANDWDSLTEKLEEYL